MLRFNRDLTCIRNLADVLNTKCHTNPSGRSRLVTKRQTDRQTRTWRHGEVNMRITTKFLRQNAEALKQPDHDTGCEVNSKHE